ncbi:hypothetical protein HZ326_6488 [Fusarium oxysporum f. sp. albedinis]|nr:hypothetical protein HZ326_6488 [Fusarium oxysporum f. sp. albedinis]
MYWCRGLEAGSEPAGKLPAWPGVATPGYPRSYSCNRHQNKVTVDRYTDALRVRCGSSAKFLEIFPKDGNVVLAMLKAPPASLLVG